MRKFLMALLVVGALVLTAVPASAVVHFQTLWRDQTSKLNGSFIICNVPQPGECGALDLRFKNRSNATAEFDCRYRSQGQHFSHFRGSAPPRSTVGTLTDSNALITNMHASCWVNYHE